MVVPPLKRFHAQSASFTRRAFPPLSTGPSLKTERFQRGRSCGTEGNPVRSAPARLHRHKPLVSGGSGGRRAAWKPRRPPAAFGSFPLRERNSCVRRRTKLPQAAPSSPVRAPTIHDPKQISHALCAASQTKSSRHFSGSFCCSFSLTYGNTAQFVGSVGDAFSAICCWQIFRFTSSKPSKSAIASDEKFIRLRTNSFVRYCLYAL